MKIFSKILFLLICIKLIVTEDPFSALGIPSLNPSQIFNTNQSIMPPKDNSFGTTRNIPQIKTPEDLQKFLKRGNFDENEGLAIVSKFLIADDYILKQNGVIFDLTGVDGLGLSEIIYPPGTKERLLQRAKSAAKIYFTKNFNDDSYEPVGAEDITRFNGNWRLYKVLLAGKNSYNQHILLRTCLPIDENLTPIVSNPNQDCMSKIQMVEEARMKNLPYLEKIRNSNIFRKSPQAIKANKEKIKKENYNNMMKNYKNYMQNQNIIQSPPVGEMNKMNENLQNNLNNVFNQFNTGINNRMNIMPNVNNVNPVQNNIKNTHEITQENLNQSNNEDVNSKTEKGLDVKNKFDNNEAFATSFKFMQNMNNASEINSKEIKEKTTENNGDETTKTDEINNKENDNGKQREENFNDDLKSHTNSMPNTNPSDAIPTQLIAKNNSKQTQTNQTPIINEFNPQFNMGNLQNMQNLMNNNQNLNNFYLNQAHLLSNPLVSQQMSLHEQKKTTNNLRANTQQNKVKINQQNVMNLQKIPSNISQISQVNIPEIAPTTNPQLKQKNSNLNENTILQLNTRINIIEGILRSEVAQNQALRNDIMIIKNNSESNFQKLQQAINQIASKFK